MAECPGGRANRGARSQFRLGMPGLGQCKGFYPISLGDIMDAGQSPQTGISSSRDFISPSKGTRTLTVREYEQTISELKTENFDLKLELFLEEEKSKKNSCADKDSSTPDQEVVQVIVRLNSEADSLRNELSYKDKLLQDALERAEKIETEFKDFEKKYAELQSELSSLSELPSKEEYSSLLDEKENLIRHTESLEKVLMEKEEEIHIVNQKVEILANENRHLEEKLKKSSLAIQGFVYKNFKEKDMLPDELKNIVISAAQAAKNNNKDDLITAVKSFHSALNKIMTTSSLSFSASEEKENIGSPQAKCLKEEIFEKCSSILCSQTESPSEIGHTQSIKEVLTERNTPETKQLKTSAIHDSPMKGKAQNESSVNTVEKDIMDYINFSISPKPEENLISFSQRSNSEIPSVAEHNALNVETVPVSLVPHNVTHREKNLSVSSLSSISARSCEESDDFRRVLKENEKLKWCLKENLAVIKYIQTICKELEGPHLQGIEKDALESIKEVLSARNISEAKWLKTSVIHDSPVRARAQKESSVNTAQRDILDHINYSTISPTTEENLISFSQRSSSETSSVVEHNVLNIETVPVTLAPQDLTHQEKNISGSSLSSILPRSSEESDKFKRILKENEKLKCDLNEKLAVIKDLQNSCKELEEQHLQVKESDALKASKLYSIETQTDIAGNNLLNEYEMMAKLQKDAKLSSNVEELREDILLLLLAIEDKNKELSDVKESLLAVQDDLKKALNTTNMLDKDFYLHERNELHERLALSCSVNEELMKHLKNLENFMEVLLQNKFDSSLESISDKSDFLNSVSRCLNKSLQLSNILSDHLSVCEGSKLFEECESFVYKNGSNFEEKSLPHSGLDIQEQNWSYSGSHILENSNRYAVKSDQSVGKESDGGQLCWRCWQQLNPLSNQLEICHLMENNTVPTHVGYPSSDSDIWSEPDRNVSMQRIGISLQNSPVSSKSPRKLRQKDKRISCRLSTEQDTSSSEFQRSSKKRQGSSSRRLFSKENIKNQDFAFENFYSLLEKKYVELKSLLEDMKCIKDGKLSNEVWIRLCTIVASAEEALQKLHTVKENTKSPVCTKCVMLELFTDIKMAYNKTDFINIDSFPEKEILQQFSKDVFILNEACKEPFPMLSESVVKKSRSTQSDILFENEQVKINELENIILNLGGKNKELNKNLHEMNALLSKEQSVLESVKTENLKLSYEIGQLKEELSDMKMKEDQLSHQNLKLIEELASIQVNNSELHSTLKNLERKEMESTALLDQLQSYLQKNRTDLVNMNEKCHQYEEQLNEQIQKKEECENKLRILESYSVSEKEKYLSQIVNLDAEKNHYIQELKKIQEIKHALEKENAHVNNNLQSKSSELLVLQETIKDLENAKETLNANYDELQLNLNNTRKEMISLQKKCNACEEALKLKENEIAYCQQLKQLEAKSLIEKNELLDKISLLTKERENILQQLKEEKKCSERLRSEKIELDENYAKTCQQIFTLKHLNKDLESEQLKLRKRNESIENTLLSSTSESDTLINDLKCMRDTLQNLESKCLGYEKQLIAAAGMKDTLVECLLNINNEFSIQRQKLNEICKTYGSENYVLWEETFFNDFVPVVDEDNVQKLSENICFETKKLSQSVDMVLGLLKSYHSKSIEIKASEENINTKELRKQMEFHKSEIEQLKLRNGNLQQVIQDLQKSVSEKEKSIQFSAYELQSLKEKLNNREKEIERETLLLKKKDDEITMLQERIFNLQTYVNSIMVDRTSSLEKSSSIVEMRDSVSSNNQLSSKPVLSVSKMCQTDEDSIQSADESIASVSSLETSRNHCCEKYTKKYHAKLSLYKKQIAILEKEKNDLRESLHEQFESRKDSFEKKESISSKQSELESKLEQKKAFISELKRELLQTCNSLINKEKEVDDLKEKLSEQEAKSKLTAFDVSDKHSIATPKSIETNVKTLKNYKWTLIQTIFDIQRTFYEKRGIHLNYFDKFKDHVTNLYTKQLTHLLPKSESMPLLGSYVLKQYEKGEDRVKELVDLEVDIECLENLKIFLKRFFVPCVLQTPKPSEIEVKQKKTSLPSEIGYLKELQHDISEILNTSSPEALIVTDPEEILQEKCMSFDIFVASVSQHLDYIQKFFTTLRYHNLSSYRLSDEDSTEKAEVKLLLHNIFDEVKILHAESEKLFSMNTVLKNSDFVATSLVPISTSKQDVSDRESLMSEETIAVSRTESPVSFEDNCPIKLPHPDTLQLEEKTLKPEPVRSKVTVIEPYNAKMVPIGSSCDSVCQRSHYSSPDLGIESDPNHDSSAPEQREDDIAKYQRHITEDRLNLKSQLKSAFTSTEPAGKWPGYKFGENLYAIGTLPNYELLKQEVKESLVAIKSVLSRTGDGLHHIAKYTSPRKTLEYNTLKSIKDTCVHMEVCLKKSYSLIGKFWTAPCPSEKEWQILNDENQNLSEQLAYLKLIIQRQETEFKKAMGKLEHAQAVKENIEKKIAKKLVKTKKVIRQAEQKLLENRCQNFPPVPKYPSDHTEQTNA